MIGGRLVVARFPALACYAWSGLLGLKSMFARGVWKAGVECGYLVFVGFRCGRSGLLQRPGADHDARMRSHRC